MMETDIRTAAVIGGGAMGHGIAEVLARRCERVWLHDAVPQVIELAGQRIGASIARLRRHGLISEETAARIPERIRTTPDLGEAAAGAQLVIEAVSENLPLKQELFGELDRITGADTIFATNSSSMRIADVMRQVGAGRQERLVGSHFFLPAQIVPLVEVSRTPATSDEVFEQIVSLWQACGKEPIRVQRDVSGYAPRRRSPAPARSGRGRPPRPQDRSRVPGLGRQGPGDDGGRG